MHFHSEYYSERVARQINYEFEMFDFLFGQLNRAFQESADRFLPGNITTLGKVAIEISVDERTRFALLESFLLHARVLRDFFYNDRPRDDDIIANHFVSDWKLHRPLELPYLFAHKLHLDKALSHLSMKRLAYERGLKKWHITAIHSEVKELIELFLGRLTEDRLAWFASEA